MNRVILGAGVLAVLAGLGAVLEPAVLTMVPSGPTTLVSLIGVLSLLEAARAGYSRYVQSVNAPSVPEPEQRLVSSVPESNVAVHPSISGRRSRHAVIAEQNRIRDQLTETAVSVLVRCDGDTSEQARERLRTGSWTDDPTAAAFFASDEHRSSVSEWVGTLLTGTDVFETQANSAVAALSERIANDQQNDRVDDEH